ncbi:MAG: 30S ribosomal protein S15 [Fimbriimonadaceae bacterium]|nr:30S ribosomal protein S15 [Chitinophagales bacterium]
MAQVTSERKKEIFKEFSGSEKNTGTVESQIALFTERINHLTEHLKVKKKDFATKRSLLMLVGKRRRFLNYMMKKDIAAYRTLIDKLNIRR